MIYIDGNHLTIDEIVRVARSNEQVSLTASARKVITRSEKWLNAIAAKDEAIYGINTGLGSFSTSRIPNEQSARLSRNLILSHAVGSGPVFPFALAKASPRGG